jgi:hypothetical protein
MCLQEVLRLWKSKIGGWDVQNESEITCVNFVSYRVLRSVNFESVVTSDKAVYDVVTIERNMKNLTALSLLQVRLCQDHLDGSKNKLYRV